MAPFKRGRIYHVDLRWRGYPRLKLTTGTTIKARAIAMERTLYALRDAGRRDILSLLANRRVTLQEVHDAYSRNPAELEHLRARAESPRLGDLVPKWLEWLRSPGGISPRRRRRYARRTVEQYTSSWEGFFSVLAQGRDSRLSDLTRGFALDYRRARKRATGGRRRKEAVDKLPSPATLNRDMAALGAFLTWVRDVEGLEVDIPRLPRERESKGRERWLSADELSAFERDCPPEWWPFFATLFFTGARMGEVQALRGEDVQMHARRITIHEGSRRVKSSESVRDLPIPEPLRQALAMHLARLPVGPGDLVFPDEFQKYGTVRRVWDQTCKRSEIAGATPHDARHTFAVQAAHAGVPIVRLQKLLGHATATMTLRYMKHAPEAYLDEDASAIAGQMTGASDREGAARAEAAREALRRA
jgi:integrase